MAFGFNYGGGDAVFNDIIKYNAKEGRFYRVDREDGENVEVEITSEFKAIFDMENLEVGWINFPAGAAPDFKMVPIRTEMPERPSSKHKNGVRCMLKLSKQLGGSVREIAGNSNVIMKAFDLLDDDFLEGQKEHPNMLPVVVLDGTARVTTGSGETKATNHRPIFKIAAWIARPDDLPKDRKAAAAAAKAEEDKPKAKQEPKPEKKAPPETGSARVSHQTVGADDFG
jgi:hypothetical protein